MKAELGSVKNIALVAHDNRKDDLINWCKGHVKALKDHRLYATGTTGQLLEKTLELPVKKFRSGPLGGDFQIGASIVEGNIDILVFFWDPLETMAHDPDIKALLRLATLWNIPMACNESSADFFISSPLFAKKYTRNLTATEDYGLGRLKSLSRTSK